MSTPALVAATVLALYLLIVSPLRGRARYLELADPTTGPERRRAIQVESIVTKWLVTVVALAVCWQVPFPIVWGVSGAGVPYTLALFVGLVGGAVLLVVSLRTPSRRQALAQAAAKFAALLPKTPPERRLFAVVAVTAGITEEAIFRGFLIAYVAWLLTGGNVYVAAVIAGVAFGVLHLYQGWKGVLQTGFIGVLFGLLYPSVGLVVLAIVHSLLDLRLLLLPLDLVGEGPTDAEPPDAEPQGEPEDERDAGEPDAVP